MGGMWLVVVVMAGAVATGNAAGAAAATTASSRLRDYAVLGLDRVALRGDVSIESGDVGCNSPSCAVSLSYRAQVAGTVAGHAVHLRRRAGAGKLFCSTLDPPRPVSASPACGPVSSPLVDAASLPIVEVHPGDAHVRVGARAVLGPLAPGAYGAVRVGRRGRLLLAGGDYDVRSLVMGRGSQLLCEAKCTIRIARRALLSEGVQLGPTPPLDARAVRIEVRGGVVRGPAAFRAMRRSIVDASVYAPNGPLLLGMNGHYAGSFVGKTVVVYERARVVGPDALRPAAQAH